MNESQLKARKTKVENNLKTKDLVVSYEKQSVEKKNGLYPDTRKRIS